MGKRHLYQVNRIPGAILKGHLVDTLCLLHLLVLFSRERTMLLEKYNTDLGP